jgi:hypothetical protein
MTTDAISYIKSIFENRGPEACRASPVFKVLYLGNLPMATILKPNFFMATGKLTCSQQSIELAKRLKGPIRFFGTTPTSKKDNSRIFADPWRFIPISIAFFARFSHLTFASVSRIFHLQGERIMAWISPLSPINEG